MKYYTFFNMACKAEEDSEDSNKSVMESCLKEENFDRKVSAGEEIEHCDRDEHCSLPETKENLSGNNSRSETFEDANFKLNVKSDSCGKPVDKVGLEDQPMEDNRKDEEQETLTSEEKEVVLNYKTSKLLYTVDSAVIFSSACINSNFAE